MISMPTLLNLSILALASLPVLWRWWQWCRRGGAWWPRRDDEPQRRAFAREVKGPLFASLSLAVLAMLVLHHR